MQVNNSIAVRVDAIVRCLGILEVRQERIGRAVIDTVRQMPVLTEGRLERLDVACCASKDDQHDAQKDDRSHRNRETELSLLFACGRAGGLTCFGCFSNFP